MISVRYKVLAFALSALSLMHCRESANLQIKAEPTEPRHSSPENKDQDGIKEKNSPKFKNSLPGDKAPQKPPVHASDTLLPKRA